MSLVFNKNYLPGALEILQRIHIRGRALIYAEYQHYSARLIENQPTFNLSVNEWKVLVTVIELRLIINENPRLIHMRDSDFEPRWIFFEKPTTRFTTFE